MPNDPVPGVTTGQAGIAVSVAGDAAVAVPRRRARELVLYVIGVAVGIVVLLLLVGKRGEITSAWRPVRRGSASWLAAAIAAEAASLMTFAFLQYRVLRIAGARVRMPALALLALANDAIANSVPGEPVVSSAYRYRYYRRYGVSGASAGWTIFTVIIAQSIGMSLLFLVGVAVAVVNAALGGAGAAGSASAAGAGLVIAAAAIAVLIRRDLLLRLAEALVRWLRRVTGHPRGTIGARICGTLARMREIPLDARSTATVIALAVALWLFDFLCLVCAFEVVGAPIPWTGVLLAYGAAQVAGALPFIPGGIGIVEGSLAVVLVAYGAGPVPAIATALVYRLVSFWLSIAVGWLSFGVIAYRERANSSAAGPNSSAK